MSSWLVLGIARASITVRTSDNGYATGPAPNLAADFPAADLAWFMETTKEALFGPEADRAAAVLEWIRALPTKDRWGTQQIKDLVAASLPADVTSLDIFICSQDPELLAFPWELVAFPAPFSHLVLGAAGRIERVEARQLLEPETLSISSTAAIDRITAMLVSPRPELQGEVPFSPTVGAALVAASRFPEKLKVDMVRPPTLDAVRRYLDENDPPDVVHFDGHGGSGTTGGRLFFEGNTPDQAVPVSGEELAEIFRGRAPRTVLLNACRSSFYLPGRDVGSVAGDISRNFPEAVVIAMSYIVGVPLVLRLMQTIYPAIGRGEDASSAVAQVRRDLFSAWKEDQAEFPKPHFLTARVFRAKIVALPPVARDSSAAAELSADERALTHWTEEILAIDRLLSRSDGLVTVVGMFGSGKTSLAKMLRRYYSLTCSPREAPHIIDYDERDADTGAAPPEAGNVIVLTARPDHTHGARYELHYPPQVLASSLVQQALSEYLTSGQDTGRLRALVFEASEIATMHLASGAAFARLATRMSPSEVIDYLRWGFRIESDDDAVRAVSELMAELGLTKDQITSFSVLGLFDGWVLSGLLTILTNGGLVGDRFFAVFGRHITEDEWNVLLDAGAATGLLDRGPGPVFRVVPLVALVLRSMLAGEFGEDGLLALQYEMALAVWGWLSRSGDIDFWSSLVENEWLSYRVQRATLSILDEENIIRALRFVIRNEHDADASQIARWYIGDRLDDHFRIALGHIARILSYERRPGVRYDKLDFSIARAQTYQTHADHKWPQCLQSADRALDLARSFDAEVGENVQVSCMRAHALARLHRVEEAIATIEQAAVLCVNGRQRDTVLEELSNIIEYLHLPDEDIQAAEQLISGALERAPVGLGGVNTRPSVRDRMEEIDYWESEQRRSLIVGDAVRAAQSAENIGRLLALAGETAQADSMLRSALDAQVRIGAPTGRTQYYLGLAWEVGGDFERSQRWLRGAMAVASSTGDDGLTADCIYELGVVQARMDAYSEALETFNVARQSYLALGREREAADALFMAAQSKLAGDGDIGEVAEMLREVLSEQPLDPRITSLARDLLEDIRTHQANEPRND